MRARLTLLATGMLLVATPALADPALPTHDGESGFLDVPTAETLGVGGGAFSLDLRMMRARDLGLTGGPSPLVLQLGLGRAEGGFALRQGGMPGDHRPSLTTATASLKVSLFEARGKRPALALDAVADQVNHNPTVSLRAIASSPRFFRTRGALFAGGVVGGDQPSGWTAGSALSILGPRETELVIEVLRTPAGRMTGAALRWQPRPQFAFGLGASYLPDDAGTFTWGITVAFITPAPPRLDKTLEGAKGDEAATQAKTRSGKPVFADERPRFRLKLRPRPLPGEGGGPARHYPGSAPEASAPEQAPAPANPPPNPPNPPNPAAPSPERPDASADAGNITAPVAPSPPRPASEPDAGLPASVIQAPAPPPPPVLGQGGHAEIQIRHAIAAFQPALKQCVERGLKHDPSLHGTGQLALDIASDGRVKHVRLDSSTLAGGWFESCLRASAERWRMPRTPKGYSVDIPLRIVVAKEGKR